MWWNDYLSSGKRDAVAIKLELVYFELGHDDESRWRAGTDCD